MNDITNPEVLCTVQKPKLKLLLTNPHHDDIHYDHLELLFIIRRSSSVTMICGPINENLCPHRYKFQKRI